MGHRMSSLPIAQFCAHGPRLGGLGAGRAAAQSTAFHALCSNQPNAKELFDRLTPEEQQELTTWRRPADIEVGGVLLRYGDARHEVEVAINKHGGYVAPDSPDAVSIGHIDFAWVVTLHGMKIAYVGDIKRSEYTTRDGVESLQLHAYGLAYAGLHDCDAYVVGIWSATEAKWQWSEIIDLMSPQAMAYAQRVVSAALNDSPDYAQGAHCRSCYGRFRCPSWVLPPELAETGLAALSTKGELTQERALELLLTYQRFVDTAKMVEGALKDYAARNRGIIDPKSKRVWRATISMGRESVSVRAVREAFGAEGDKIITRGKPYEVYRWTDLP